MAEKTMELYIHIPFCVKKCNYCDFLSFPANEDTQRAYMEALLREVAYYGGKCRDYCVTTVYIGGGTPTCLAEDALVRLMEAVCHAFAVKEDAEITIECNPGTVTERKLRMYRDAGINRISIGLQSANDDELRLLGRVHTYDQFLKTYDMARRSGFGNVNIDLINALPEQTAEGFSHTLQQVLRLKPEHLSVYSLMVEKGTPFYDIYKFDVVKQQAGLRTVSLPTEDEVYRITKVTERMLAEAGYRQYEISNFARPGFACRHNIGYWERENYLGLGLGAASLMENIRYSNIGELYPYMDESKRIREGLWQNETEELPATNMHASAERITRKAQIEEFMFLGLRLTEGITRERFAACFGVEIEALYEDVMRKLEGSGLLAKRAGHIFLTEKGRDLSNYALAQFLQP